MLQVMEPSFIRLIYSPRTLAINPSGKNLACNLQYYFPQTWLVRDMNYGKSWAEWGKLLKKMYL